ncbi:MAG: hypothetical protein ACFB0B_03850 [Thermonemataceae bacterium]
MKEKIKVIKIIHLALVSGVTLIYVVLGNLHTFNFLRILKTESSAFTYLLVAVAAILLGNFLYKQQLKNTKDNLTLEEKVVPYQTALLTRWVILEGAAFIILFIEKEWLIIGLFLIVYMAFLRPSEERMKRDFQAIGK